MSKDIWPIGHKIKGRYEIRDIKLGGMAIVYLCFDHEFKEHFAVKTFKDEFLSDKAVINRFFLEAESWMRLEKHKNIVWSRWVDKINDRPYIFLEYIQGHKQYGLDLLGWIINGGLNDELCLNYAIQICTGMIYAGRKFTQMKRLFVHRDIKPANIFITSDGIVKVTDFGLMKVCDEVEGNIERSDEEKGIRLGLTKIGNICGTPPYMSPEQWMGGKDQDIRSDIYAFGCVLYEMITGRPPFIARSFEDYQHFHLEIIPYPPKVLQPYIKSELNNLVMKCLEKSPENRHHNFEVIRDILNHIYEQSYGKRIEYVDEGEELSIVDLSNTAMSLHELGRSKEAISYYDRIITRIVDEIEPEMVARVFNNRANCYMNLQDYRKALANYELAKRIDSHYDFPWYNSAGCYINLGDYQKAFHETNQAIKINPHFPDSYARRANIHLYFGRLKEAIEDSNQAIQLEPRHVDAYRIRARAYQALGDVNKAHEDHNIAKKFEIRSA